MYAGSPVTRGDPPQRLSGEFGYNRKVGALGHGVPGRCLMSVTTLSVSFDIATGEKGLPLHPYSTGQTVK